MRNIQKKVRQLANGRLYCAGFFLILIFGIALVRTARGESGHTVKEVLDAWKTRQAKVETAQFEFEERMVHPEGTLSFGNGPPPGTKPASQPDHDAVFDRRVRLFLAGGGKIRYEVEGKAWVQGLAGFVPQTYISTTNGSVNKTFYGKGSIGEELHPCGFVNNESTNIDAGNYHIRPFLLLVRPLDRKAGGLSEEGWTLAVSKAVVESHSCLVLKQTGSSNNEYWVDPERQMIVLRYLRKSRGKEFVRCTCSYKEDPKCGWVPDTWEGTMFQSDQTVRENVHGRMLRYEINSPLKDVDFEFSFPPGTEVSDHVAKTRYIPLKGGGVQYLAGRDYVTVMASGSPTHRWYSASFGCVLLLVIIIGFLRYRHRIGGKIQDTPN